MKRDIGLVNPDNAADEAAKFYRVAAEMAARQNWVGSVAATRYADHLLKMAVAQGRA